MPRRHDTTKWIPFDWHSGVGKTDFWSRKWFRQELHPSNARRYWPEGEIFTPTRPPSQHNDQFQFNVISKRCKKKRKLHNRSGRVKRRLPLTAGNVCLSECLMQVSDANRALNRLKSTQRWRRRTRQRKLSYNLSQTSSEIHEQDKDASTGWQTKGKTFRSQEAFVQIKFSLFERIAWVKRQLTGVPMQSCTN